MYYNRPYWFCTYNLIQIGTYVEKMLKSEMSGNVIGIN